MPDATDLPTAKASACDYVDLFAAALKRHINEAATQDALDAIGRRAMDRMPDLLEGE